LDHGQPRGALGGGPDEVQQSDRPQFEPKAAATQHRLRLKGIAGPRKSARRCPDSRNGIYWKVPEPINVSNAPGSLFTSNVKVTPSRLTGVELAFAANAFSAKTEKSAV
jgi:hypothetical protein